jgi:hypothetical protein
MEIIIEQKKDSTFTFPEVIHLKMNDFEQVQKLVDLITDNNEGATVEVAVTVTLPTPTEDGEDA